MNHPLAATWEQQRRWSMAANRLKSTYGRWHQVALVIAVIAAVLETLASQLPDGAVAPAVAGLGALIVATGPVVRRYKVGTSKLRGWVAARSVSEALKAEIYQYLVRCGAYSEGDPDETLIVRRGAILRGIDDSLVDGIAPDQRPVPTVRDIDGYMKSRVDDQLGYYRTAAAREQRSVTHGQRVQLLLAVIAAVLGAVAVFTTTTVIAAWVAVVTTIAASFAAHIAVGRHEHAAITYGATANRLRELRDLWSSGAIRDACDFVARCEAAISVQNEGWMARFMSDD